MNATCTVDATGTLLSSGEELTWRAERRGAWTVPFLECPQHLPIVLRIRSAIDRRALQAALDEVMRRHDVLRSRYRDTADAAVRVVMPSAPMALNDVDLRTMPEAERSAALEWLLDDQVGRPFDLAEGPLLRAMLVTLGADDHVLAIVVHHIAFDGASRRLLVLELGRLYDAHAAGTTPDLPTPPATYADYVAWQRGRLTAATLPRLRSYWTSTLRGLPDLQLPVDRANADRTSTRCASIAFEIGGDDLGRLREVARLRRATTASALLAGFQLLLSRLAGVDDVAVGMPIADRRRVEFFDLIGLFSNVIVVRTRVSAARTFDDLVTRVRDDLREASNHQDLPYGELVRLMPERTLYRVAFNYMRADAESIPKLGMLDSEEMEYAAPRHAVADLNLQLHERRDRVCGRLFYKADCWTSDGIADLVRAFQSLLRDVLAKPSHDLSTTNHQLSCAGAA